METATTTCTHATPLISHVVGGVLTFIPPDANNQNFQYQTEQCTTVYSSSGSTTEQFYKGLSLGNILISMFLLLIFSLFFLKFLLDRLLGVRYGKAGSIVINQ